jgi:acetyl-CoA acetyltransferase
MTPNLLEERPVYVIGIGLHRYQRASATTYVDLGLTAIREALVDSALAWKEVESAYVATVMLGMAAGRTMLRYLGATGLSMVQVENASASGSSAVRLACLEVASGESDVALAVGVDKPGIPNFAPARTGLRSLVGGRIAPVGHFALLTNEYMNRNGVSAPEVAAVAVKNHNNGAKNPYAQRQKPRTLDEVMGEAPVAGSLTRLQCCPFGEGAAAVIVASEEGIERVGFDRSRAIRVMASVAESERLYEPGQTVIVELTRETVAHAYAQAKVRPEELDVVEVHDAFSIEELLYTEALGLCGEGEGARYLASGATDIGGDCAVSPSGGLLAMGHPFGPTGVGQIAEITRQLRGEAGSRQQPNSRVGLAHMVGVGQVCVVHVLTNAG